MSYFAVGAGPTVMTVSPEAVTAAAAATRSSTRVVATRPAECPSGTGTGYVLDPAGFWRRAKCGEVGQAAPPGAKVVDQRTPSAIPASVFGLPTTTVLLIGGVATLGVVVLLRRRRKATP